MTLLQRSNLLSFQLRTSLAIVLAFLPTFLIMDYAQASTREDQITQLTQASNSYAERFHLAQKRIVYMYNLPVNAGPFLNSYNVFNAAIQQLSTDNQNISAAESNLSAAQLQLDSLPQTIDLAQTAVSTSQEAVSTSQATYDSLQPSYSQAVQDRDSAYSAYLATVVNSNLLEDFNGGQITSGMRFTLNGFNNSLLLNSGNPQLQNGRIFVNQYGQDLYIRPPLNSQPTTLGFETYARNGDQTITVTFTDNTTATFTNPNGVGNPNCPDYYCTVSYTAPAGKFIQSYVIPGDWDILYLDKFRFSSNSHNPTAYQTYLDAQAALDLLTPDYNAASTSLASAQQTLDQAVITYASVSSQQYQDQLSTNVQTRQQQLDTANNDYTISYNDALTKQNDALIELEAYEVQAPAVPDAPDFPANTVFYAGDEGWQITIQAPQYAYLTNVLFASYGTPDNFNTTACHAASTSDIIQSMIDSGDRVSSITFPADNGTFGDPCGGTPKWSQFAVQYEYAPTLLPPTNIQVQENNDGSVTITWNPSQTLGGAQVERYAVFFDDSQSAGWAVSSTTTQITIDASTFESAGGLDITYNFKVRADNDTQGIYSEFSQPVQADVAIIQPTPEPTLIPTPSEPTPTPTVTPEPTPSPTPSPTLTPTPTPTPQPTETPTPTPTPSVEPTPTPTPTTPQPTPSPTPSETPSPTPTPEPTKEPTPTEKPVVAEIAEPITAENIEALVEELTTIAPQDLTEEQQTLIVEAALEVFASAEQGSPEYQAALDALLVVAQADDIVIDEELAAVPVVGAAVVALADAFNALGNAGADMSPQVREQSEKVVIAAVIVGQVAMTATAAATSAAASAARR